eukprot:m.219987 g.219987  ORF g.219987 m.219987 type:complete len:168 (+) comp54142_c0_seq13:300-803(+)
MAPTRVRSFRIEARRNTSSRSRACTVRASRPTSRISVHFELSREASAIERWIYDLSDLPGILTPVGCDSRQVQSVFLRAGFASTERSSNQSEIRTTGQSKSYPTKSYCRPAPEEYLVRPFFDWRSEEQWWAELIMPFSSFASRKSSCPLALTRTHRHPPLSPITDSS